MSKESRARRKSAAASAERKKAEELKSMPIEKRIAAIRAQNDERHALAERIRAKRQPDRQ